MLTKNKRETGSLWEEKTADFLIEQGYEILERNFRCAFGEIDIIAREGGYLVFIEVKYRKNQCMGTPYEAVNVKKQQTISRCADYYRMKTGISDEVPCRFDVAGITGTTISIIKNAFPHWGY